ncbi:MAG: tRNA (5-methylaminomethyl-2-thiouridine)(34)-methyltransferase MnmD [Bacteroidia bacterium]|nr:tRNA (5-methylaminomethyl-2-thiouridine)(34)-methyltransferase MnmD [Bacteroidia bacterium]
MEDHNIPENPIRENIISKDGSSTLWAPDFDEHYHSIHGALTESLHVFIEAGLQERTKTSSDELHVFEMGFGTGLNALLTYFHKSRPRISYTSIEKYPIPEEAWEGLNYAEKVGEEGATELFRKFHSSDWGRWVEMGKDFSLKKLKADLLDFESEDQFDLIYFDAFAPSSQAYLWTEELMKKIFNWCRPGAIFTTYSAKGDVRRALIAAGFEVEKIPGPPGKREMLRARKL